jgi:hypothetical protein
LQQLLTSGAPADDGAQQLFAWGTLADGSDGLQQLFTSVSPTDDSDGVTQPFTSGSLASGEAMVVPRLLTLAF